MSKRILLKGIVQGVGCRQYCIRYARKNLFSGCVSNLRDGNVELLLDDSGRSEGEISHLISDLKHNSSGYIFYGRIDEIEVLDYKGQIRGDYRF